MPTEHPDTVARLKKLNDDFERFKNAAGPDYVSIYMARVGARKAERMAAEEAAWKRFEARLVAMPEPILALARDLTSRAAELRRVLEREQWDEREISALIDYSSSSEAEMLEANSPAPSAETAA